MARKVFPARSGLIESQEAILQLDKANATAETGITQVVRALSISRLEKIVFLGRGKRGCFHVSNTLPRYFPSSREYQTPTVSRLKSGSPSGIY